MALTKTDRAVLKIARRLIVSRKERHICKALDSIEEDVPDAKKSCKKLKLFIERALKGAYVLETWQEENGFGDRCYYQCRLDRIAWIDYLLSC